MPPFRLLLAQFKKVIINLFFLGDGAIYKSRSRLSVEGESPFRHDRLPVDGDFLVPRSLLDETYRNCMHAGTSGKDLAHHGSHILSHLRRFG